MQFLYKPFNMQSGHWSRQIYFLEGAAPFIAKIREGLYIIPPPRELISRRGGGANQIFSSLSPLRNQQ